MMGIINRCAKIVIKCIIRIGYILLLLGIPYWKGGERKKLLGFA